MADLQVTVTKAVNDKVVVFTSQQRETIGKLFVRIQEFYESEYASIRGNYFTLDEYKEIYTRERNEPTFQYFGYWLGFNVPGSVVMDFCNLFGKEHGDIHPNEQLILNEIKPQVAFNDPRFYIIGYWLGKDDVDPILNDVCVHEMCHALYYLDHNFRKSALDLLRTIPQKLRKQLYAKIADKGYGNNVLLDEANAYMSTSDIEYMEDRFDIPELLEYQRPFIDNFLIYAQAFDPKYSQLTTDDILQGKYTIRD